MFICRLCDRGSFRKPIALTRWWRMYMTCSAATAKSVTESLLNTENSRQTGQFPSISIGVPDSRSECISSRDVRWRATTKTCNQGNCSKKSSVAFCMSLSHHFSTHCWQKMCLFLHLTLVATTFRLTHDKNYTAVAHLTAFSRMPILNYAFYLKWNFKTFYTFCWKWTAVPFPRWKAKCLHGLAPQYWHRSSSLNFACQSRTLLVADNSSLQAEHLYIFLVTTVTNYGRRAFSCADSHACNLLSENVRKSTISTAIFKLSLKHFYSCSIILRIQRVRDDLIKWTF